MRSMLFSAATFGLLLLGPAVLPGILPMGRASAGDFRIETEIFAGTKPEACGKNLTLFSGGVVYDFVDSTTEDGTIEITIFDPRRERIILIDVGRKVQTVITTKELQKRTIEQQAKARKGKSLAKFLADPKLDTKFDAESGELHLTSPYLNYLVRGVKGEDEAVSQYQDFSDCYAKLNCTRPGGSPPFARLELNHALAKRGLVPTEVELTIQGNKYRSAHQVTWRLIGSDTARIDSIGDHISNYKEISFDTYRSNAGTSTTAASAASEKR